MSNAPSNEGVFFCNEDVCTMSSELNYEQLDSTSGAYNWGKNVAGGVRNAVCGLWRDYPGAFLGAPLPGTEGFRQFGEGFWNTVCPPDSQPHPSPDGDVFDGGQCDTLYNVRVNATLKDDQNPGFSEDASYNTTAIGAIQGIVEVPAAKPSQQYAIRSIRPNGQVVTSGVLGTSNRGFFTGVSITVLSRVDGQPDNCGNSQRYPNTPIIPDSRRRNIPVPIPLPNSSLVTININEIQIDNTFNIPVNVKVNNQFNIQFDLGGVKFDFPNNSIGGGATDLTPVLTPINQIQRDLVDLSGTTQDIYDSRLRLIDNNISIAVCTDGEPSEQQITVKTIADGNGNSLSSFEDNLFAQLYSLRTEGQIVCLPQSNAEVILQGSTVNGAGVIVSHILQPPSIGYLIEILTYDINRLRTYMLSGDDSEFGFGNVSLTSSNNAVIGDYVRLFTTKTFIPADSIKFPHRVRVSLKKGITFRVVDLGYTPA